MGQSKNKLKRFLDQSRFCIFCGGGELANTQDHLPPRSFLIDRKWPEGYVFSACSTCNNQSSDAEYVASIFAKIGWSLLPDQNVDPKIYEKVFLELKSKKPFIFDAMQNEIPAAAKKRIIRKAGFEPQAGTAIAEVPIVRIPVEVDEYMRVFGLKLAKALHYKHTGFIVPVDFRYKCRWITNFQEVEVEFQKIVKAVQNFEPAETLKRDNLDLSAQFRYSYAITHNSKSSAFYCKFSNSFSLVILLTFDQEIFERFD